MLRAEELVKNQQYDRAKSLYDSILKTKPKNKKEILAKISQIDSILLHRENELKYQSTIDIADQYFNDKMYEEAKQSYQQAEQYLVNESYPKEQILLIEDILAENDKPKSAYYVIVGSFSRMDYAERMQNKLKSENYESYIIDRPNNFKAVSMSRYSNLTDAWNNLPKASFINEEAWVLFYEAD